MRKLMLMLSALTLVSLFSTSALAEANFVYHEQTGNNTDHDRNAGTPGTCGKYVDNTDRSATGGFQVYSPESYTLRFKIEFQFYTNQVRVFYTTDGTNPSTTTTNTGGVTDVNSANASTNELTATYTCIFPSSSPSGIVDVATATIPPQPTGTTVKYIVVAWHTGGGRVIYGNSGACPTCFACENSSCATLFQYDVIAPPATPLVISEFRLNGPGASPTPSALQQQSDEFIEIYNNSNSDVTVNAYDGSAGFAVVASDNITRFTIPNGTVIPARGHFLGVNNVGYTLGGYPAGDGSPAYPQTTATGDITYPLQIPTNSGIAIFNTANPLNFTTTNRLDAVGSSSEGNTLYKEDTGYAPVTVFPVEYSLYRRNPGGCTGSISGNCQSVSAVQFTAPPTVYPQDTNRNQDDFILVDTQGTPMQPGGQRLGAPGPENLSSPVVRNGAITSSLIAPCTGQAEYPNRERDTTPNAANNSTYGTLTARRRFTNNTGAPVTRLRFRIVDITTFPALGSSCSTPGAPGCVAWLVAVNSSDTTVNNPCGGVNTVRGTTLEEPPAQPNGGAYNSTLSAGIITLANPLPPTDNPATPQLDNTIDVQWVLGVQQTGKFRFYWVIEALP